MIYFQQSQSVQTLIHEAYVKFGEVLQTQKIEELRNKHRRRTVHQFELDAENSIVKYYKDNGYFSDYFFSCFNFLFLYVYYSYFDEEELRMLLSIIRDEKLCVKKHFTKNSLISEPVTPVEIASSFSLNDGFQCTAGIRNSMDKSDSFKVDFDTFRLLFTELTQWGKCHDVDLAEKLFRVI